MPDLQGYVRQKPEANTTAETGASRLSSSLLVITGCAACRLRACRHSALNHQGIIGEAMHAILTVGRAQHQFGPVADVLR